MLFNQYLFKVGLLYLKKKEKKEEEVLISLNLHSLIITVYKSENWIKNIYHNDDLKNTFGYYLFCWKLKIIKKVTVWVLVNVHMSDCMNSATDTKLKKIIIKKVKNADAKSKQTLLECNITKHSF